MEKRYRDNIWRRDIGIIYGDIGIIYGEVRDNIWRRDIGFNMFDGWIYRDIEKY